MTKTHTYYTLGEKCPCCRVHQLHVYPEGDKYCPNCGLINSVPAKSVNGETRMKRIHVKVGSLPGSFIVVEKPPKLGDLFECQTEKNGRMKRVRCYNIDNLGGKLGLLYYLELM